MPSHRVALALNLIEPSIDKLATRLAKEGPHKVHPTPRLVQALYNGAYVVKTTSALFVWEHPYYPQLYIPQSAVTSEAQLKQGSPIESDTSSVIGHRYTLTVGKKSTDEIVIFSDKLEGAAAPLAGLVRITFSAMDQWFEESTPIFVHPKDPFKRVDILASSRPVRVFIDDVLVADAPSSMHLYETGLPARYYLPLTSIKAEVLRPSNTRTKCPYKGEAEYYSVEVNGKLHEDVIWYYRNPTLESIKVEGELRSISKGGTVADIEQDFAASTTKRSRLNWMVRSSRSHIRTSRPPSLARSLTSSFSGITLAAVSMWRVQVRSLH